MLTEENYTQSQALMDSMSSKVNLLCDGASTVIIEVYFIVAQVHAPVQFFCILFVKSIVLGKV